MLRIHHSFESINSFEPITASTPSLTFESIHHLRLHHSPSTPSTSTTSNRSRAHLDRFERIHPIDSKTTFESNKAAKLARTWIGSKTGAPQSIRSIRFGHASIRTNRFHRFEPNSMPNTQFRTDHNSQSTDPNPMKFLQKFVYMMKNVHAKFHRN